MKYRIKKVKKVLLFFFCALILSTGLAQFNDQKKVKKYEEKRNVKKLIKVMKDKDEGSSVRVQATNALGRLKDARAVKSLIASLNDKYVRKNSVWALGKIGDKKAVGPLILVLTDISSLGREEAAEALDGLGWKPAVDKERAYYLAAKRDWAGCEELGNLAIEPLVRIMNDGPGPARIGAMETLDRLSWKPDKDNEEAYDATKILRVERLLVIEKIVREEMKIQAEFVANLQKLKEDQKAGNLNLTEEEFMSLEKRFNQDIIREQEEIEAFRTIVSNSMRMFPHREGYRIAIEEETGEEGGQGVIVHETGLGRDIWYNAWTRKPKREYVRRTGNFYRYNIKGDKYLYAKFKYSESGSVLIIDILEPDGSPRERIFWRDRIITRIGQDKWVEWPKDIKLAQERLKFITEGII